MECHRSARTHGVEIPGYLSAGADAARETVVLLCLVWQLFEVLKVPHERVYWDLPSSLWGGPFGRSGALHGWVGRVWTTYIA